MRSSLRRLEWWVAVPLMVFLSSCDRSDPIHVLSDTIEEAHGAWVDFGATDYGFEIISTTVFSATYRDVAVQEGSVVSALGSDGIQVSGHTPTIDTLWQQILAAGARGDLHFASFDERGVPDVVDYGDWDLDGGVRHRIVSFELR